MSKPIVMRKRQIRESASPDPAKPTNAISDSNNNEDYKESDIKWLIARGILKNAKQEKEEVHTDDEKKQYKHFF